MIASVSRPARIERTTSSWPGRNRSTPNTRRIVRSSFAAETVTLQPWQFGCRVEGRLRTTRRYATVEIFSDARLKPRAPLSTDTDSVDGGRAFQASRRIQCRREDFFRRRAEPGVRRGHIAQQTDVDGYIRDHQAAIVREFMELVAIP